MKDSVKEILRYKLVNKLKTVERISSTGNRKESSAEHTWGALLLADYYLAKAKSRMNWERIYELLMYHDLVEIYAGDTPLHPDVSTDKKEEEEKRAADKLKRELPGELAEKFHALFTEFEKAETAEAKFAKAIDTFEALIHEIDHKVDWKGWTKQFLLARKLKRFEDFPGMKQDFLDLCDYLEEEGYFSQ
jgi:putative hydrolase of HD superfamily